MGGGGGWGGAGGRSGAPGSTNWATRAPRGRADGANTNGADKTHWADKVASVNAASRTVSYNFPNVCYEDQSVHYVSLDASAAGPAAIEDVTFAPALGNVPFPDCGTNDINVNGPFINPGCARESLIAFTNGQTGKDNVQRQGLNAAILDQESPLNILEDVPNNGGQFNYSPMWTSTWFSGMTRCRWPADSAKRASPPLRHSLAHGPKASPRRAHSAMHSRRAVSS